MEEEITIYLLAEHSDLLYPGGATYQEIYLFNLSFGNSAIKYEFERVTSCNMSGYNLTEFLALVGRCQNMRFLFLSGNSIRSVARIAVFPHLIKLDLSNNYLTSLGFRTFWESLKDLRFLYLSGNRLQNLRDLDVIRDLQHISVLTLFLNPIASAPRYHKYVLDLLPTLNVLDNIRICPTDKIGNIDTYAAKSRYYHYPCANYLAFKQEYSGKTVQHVLARFNAEIDNANMLDSTMRDYHDVFCCEQFNVYAACMDCRAILLKHDNCPLTIIYKTWRMALALRRVERYKNCQSSAVQTIQKYTRGYCAYNAFHNTIITRLKTKKSSARVILLALRARLRQRQTETEKLVRLKRKYSAIKIIKAMRERKSVRFAINFETIAHEYLHQPQTLNLFVAKTFDTEYQAFRFMRQLCDFIKDEISSSLMGNPQSELHNYRYCYFEFNATRYKIVSARRPSACKQVFVCSLSRSLAKVRAYQVDIETFIQTRRLSRSLVMQTASLPYSKYARVKRDLASLSVGASSEEAQHDFYANGGEPYYFHFRVVQKDIAAIFKYSMQEIYGVKWPDTAEYVELIYYGSFIFNKLLAAGLKHQLVQLFSENTIPISLFSKQNVNSKLFIAIPETVRLTASALTIQKVFRAHRSNAKLCYRFAESMGYSSVRVSRIFLIQMAAQVIQRRIRGVFSRTRCLILSKMRDIFTSALECGVFLIKESTIEALKKNPRPAKWLKALHVNYSAPLNQQFAHGLFDTIDLYSMNITLANTAEWRQFASLPYTYSNLFSAFNGYLFSTPQTRNAGYIQLSSSFLGDSPLTSKALVSWVRQLPEIDYRDFEFFAAHVLSQKKAQYRDEDFIDLEAIKAMCGLRRCAESNAELDRLLDLFYLNVRIDELNYQTTVENIFHNIEITDFDESLFPRHLRALAYSYTVGYKMMRLPRDYPIHKADIAFKGLLLELLFCDPGVFISRSQSFIARKWIFSAQGGITMSISTLGAVLAAIYLQKHIRGYLAVKRFKERPRHSSLLKKINTLFKEEGLAYQSYIEQAQREVAAINLLKYAYQTSRKRATYQAALFESAEMKVFKAPVYRTAYKAAIGISKHISASEIRYQTCIYSAAKEAFQQKLQTENRLKIQTVRDLTSGRYYEQAALRKEPYALVLQLQGLVNKEMPLPALRDQIRTSRLQNQNILAPLCCQSPQPKTVSISKSQPGSEGDIRRPNTESGASDAKLAIRHVVNYDLRYFSAQMQRRQLLDQVRLNAYETRNRRRKESALFQTQLVEREQQRASRVKSEHDSIMCQAEKRRLEVVQSRARLRSRHEASSQLSYCRALQNGQ